MAGRRRRVREAALKGALALGLVATLAAGAGRAQTGAADPEPLRQEAREGPVRITLEADRRTMPIEGRLRLTLQVEAPAGAVVTMPAVADRLGPFVVASQTAQAPSGEGAERARWRRDYLLEAEDVGLLTVPPLTIGVRGALEGETRELVTRPLAVTVTSVLPAEVDLTAFKDIAPPLELPPAAWPRLVWPLAALAFAAVCLALVVRWRRRRAAATAVPARPAHLLALAELARLERRLPGDPPATEELFVRLADILRRYLALRFGLSAPSQTTEELLAAVDRTGQPVAARRQLIGGVLAQCDLVKFARQQPAPAALDASLRAARAFIEQTAEPQAVVAPAAVGAA